MKKILGCEIRAEVGAVAEDRTVFYEAIAKEYSLPSHHVSTAEESFAPRVLYHLGNWWLVIVGVESKYTHDEKADHQDKPCCPNPTAGNHSQPLINRLHMLPRKMKEYLPSAHSISSQVYGCEFSDRAYPDEAGTRLRSKLPRPLALDEKPFRAKSKVVLSSRAAHGMIFATES